MSCPVQVAIQELYKTGRYDDESTDSSCFSSDMLFYITQRKIEFTRAGSSDHNGIIVDSTISIYHERMFKSYVGKSSRDIFWMLFKPICDRFCFKYAQTVDMLIIMENICEKELSRSIPDNMSLPEIEFDPMAISNIETDPASITDDINKLVKYANKLCVGGIKTTVSLLESFDNKLREFTFEGDPNELMSQNMEVAEYAYQLEKYYYDATKKLSDVTELCQKIIDL